MTAAMETNLWYLPALGTVVNVPSAFYCAVCSFARRQPTAERLLYLSVSEL